MAKKKEVLDADQLALREKLIKNLIKNTKKWTTTAFGGGDNAVSEKANKIGKAIEAAFDGNNKQKKEVAKAFGYLLGENIPIQEDDKMELPALVALKLTEVFDNHSYTTGSMIIHTNEGICIDDKGNSGTWIQPPKKYVVPCTEEEIKEMSDELFLGVCKNVILVA